MSSPTPGRTGHTVSPLQPADVQDSSGDEVVYGGGADFGATSHTRRANKGKKSIKKWIKKGGHNTQELGNNLLAHQDLDEGANANANADQLFSPSNPFRPVTADLGNNRDTVWSPDSASEPESPHVWSADGPATPNDESSGMAGSINDSAFPAFEPAFNTGPPLPTPNPKTERDDWGSAWFWWTLYKLKDQVRVLVPIAIVCIMFQTLALETSVKHLGGVIGGLACVIVGLSTFMVGLEIGVMPLGEAMGRHLPQKCSTTLMLFLVFVLGVGCTFAEPAVTALQIAGTLIDPENSPYLWLLLVDPVYNLALVFAIALGVGVAALVGTLRTIKRWSLTAIIFGSTLAPLLLTFMLQFSPAVEVAGMAWDSGAVTTGCVTVPLVLALGVGIMSSTQPNSDNPAPVNPLDGFGIVTLASLYPVCFVLMLGLAIGDWFSVDDIIERRTHGNKTIEELNAELGEQSSWMVTPWLEMFLAIRAITPLVGFLVLVFKLIIKEPFPRVTVGPDTHKIQDVAVWYGVAASCTGLFIFNIGLTYGLSDLGNQVGNALPKLFVDTTDDYGQTTEAILPKDSGLTVAALFVWLLGLGATLAEPALNQLGITTEELTKGVFKRVLVLGSVASGVSVGVMLGALKLVLELDSMFFYLIYAGYGTALVLTWFSTIDFVCVAWDSAGVTTGAITVPLVLAVGLGIGNAVNAVDAFGLLAFASIAPIISVLTTGLVLAKCYGRGRLPSGGGAGGSDLAPAQSQKYSELDTTLSGHDDPRDVAHDHAPSLKKEYGLSDDNLAQPDADDTPSPVFMGLGVGDGGNAGLVEC